MSALTPGAIRAAKERLYSLGLRTDGAYGEPDGPCCTIGHIAAALGELVTRPELGFGYPAEDCIPVAYVPTGRHLEMLLDDFFQEWNPSAACFVADWNDGLDKQYAIDAVAAFYDFIEQLAEARGELS